MSKFIVKGGKTLSGNIVVSGAKNAALKILPASILAKTESVITNVPDIEDIHKIIEIIESIGAKISFNNGTVTIDPRPINSYAPDEKLVKKLRGSIVLMGPLLAKFGQAVFSEPGGCLIGARPIDDHLDVFTQMGIQIREQGERFHLIGKPKASKIILNKMSVTATENAIMAAVLTEGITEIHVAAAEPEIIDLANYLNKMGAKIKGAGTHDIEITGVSELNGTQHEIMPDRIEAGTYLLAAIATNSILRIGPVISDHLSIILKKLQAAGACFDIVEERGREYIVTKKHDELKSQDIDTRTYPGFPTDLQSPFAVLMTQAKGSSQIFETLFEGRFLYLEELKTMDADIDVLSPHIITVNGPTKLKAQEIYSRDIRGGAALVIAALIASGTTIINGVEYIDRGYEHMNLKLSSVGAEIERVD